MKYVITILLAMGITPTFCQAATVDPGWNFEYSGFEGGGTLTGMFYGTPYSAEQNWIDLGNLTSFMATWSGNATIPAHTWDINDLVLGPHAFVYNNDTNALEWWADDNTAGTVSARVFAFGSAAIALEDAGTVINSDGTHSIIPKVPVPAAVWLFGSGLIGLVGMARRKKA